jgi:bifunctional non-homologous end joining protein LigD
MIKSKGKLMLEEYKRKRDFARTPEPSPERQQGSGPLIFVIHKHSASRLHYDLRLEADGVLKSWAVPQGPSLNPKVKRLAVMVEDHPLDYHSFEGVIPAGEYGAGQVIIWDQGTYWPEEEGGLAVNDREKAQELVRKGLEKGKISFHLDGVKLNGSWALVKMQRTKNDWLLIKHGDDYAKSGVDVLEQDASVVSGITIEDLKQGKSPPKKINIDLSKIPGSRSSPFQTSISPMLASLASKPFTDPGWIFEPKLDGYRTTAFIQNQEARLVSRSGLVVSQKYPDLTAELNNLKLEDMALDGEVVALDTEGRSCFQCLQDNWPGRTLRTAQEKPKTFSLIYYIFDILYLNGYDLRAVPLIERKKLLSEVLSSSGHIRLVEYFENDGASLFEAAVNLGLEGIIAKLKDGIYESGRRSQDWLKIKNTQSDEFVIGGFTQGSGNRESTFGALLLGSYNEKGELIFNGHVGSGFDDADLTELRKLMDSIQNEKSPFAQMPPLEGPVTWVRPVLTTEVKFAEKTREGYLRIPVFLRLREDKSVIDIQSETPPSKHLSVDIEGILGQLKNEGPNLDLDLDGIKVPLTNLDKPIWPANNDTPAVTKRDLLIYLIKVSPFILPHLLDRPLTLTRYPHGTNDEHFYQKHWDGILPKFVETASLSEQESSGQDYLLCNNLPTLIWLGQLADIEIHTWFSRITPEPTLSPPESGSATPDFYSHYPDFIIFDIDPYIYSGNEPGGAEPELNRKAFVETGKVALWLKEILDQLSLTSFVKTSGKTGLHIHVPIYRRFDFPQVHAAAKTVATFLLQHHPQEITIDWAVAKRSGKIFLDYNQNMRGKTLASVYSPRSLPQATVSTPLLWSEVGNVYPTDFTVRNVPERLAKMGDIWKDILAQRSNLSKILK